MTPEGVRVAFDPLSFTAAGQTILGCTYGSCVPDRDFPRFAALLFSPPLPLFIPPL